MASSSTRGTCHRLVRSFGSRSKRRRFSNQPTRRALVKSLPCSVRSWSRASSFIRVATSFGATSISSLPHSISHSDPTSTRTGSLWLMLCGREEMEVAPKEVATRMNDEARDQDLTEQGKDFTNARRVGWLLKRLRFERLPNDRTKRWHVPRVELEAIARAYGIALG